MGRTIGTAASLLLALAAGGCAEAGGTRGSSGGWPSGDGGLDDMGGEDAAEDAGDAGDSGSGGGTTADDPDSHGNGDGQGGDAPKFDLPNGTAGEVPEETYGCAKVDFVFVIDSSGSMGDEQDNLLNSFPGFISAIEQTLMIDDFHVLVVDAGPVAAFGCEGSLGAGQIKSAAGQDCGLGGTRYADEATPDLAGAFTCMASRGFEGSPNEKTMDALVNSVTVLNGAGQCNAGFLRDDAILVATVISDEEDDSFDGLFNPPLDGSCQAADQDINSFGSPAAWKDALVGAKNGNEEAVVLLGLFGDCDVGGACPGINYDPDDPVTPYTGAEPAPRLRAFANSFTYGSVGPVCAPDYAPFFAAAVSVIDTACGSFEPPG